MACDSLARRISNSDSSLAFCSFSCLFAILYSLTAVSTAFSSNRTRFFRFSFSVWSFDNSFNALVLSLNLSLSSCNRVFFSLKFPYLTLRSSIFAFLSATVASNLFFKSPRWSSNSLFSFSNISFVASSRRIWSSSVISLFFSSWWIFLWSSIMRVISWAVALSISRSISSRSIWILGSGMVMAGSSANVSSKLATDILLSSSDFCKISRNDSSKALISKTPWDNSVSMNWANSTSLVLIMEMTDWWWNSNFCNCSL